MNRKRIIAIVGAGAASLALCGSALPAASAKTPVPLAAGNTFVLKAKTLTTGASATTLKPGVRIWQTESLKSGGKHVGTSFISCTVIGGTIAECDETWDFGALQAGTIQGAGDVDLSPAADDAELTITGGTEQFEEELGQVDISFDTDTTTTYTFDLENVG